MMSCSVRDFIFVDTEESLQASWPFSVAPFWKLSASALLQLVEAVGSSPLCVGQPFVACMVDGEIRCFLRGGEDAPPSSESALDARLALRMLWFKFTSQCPTQRGHNSLTRTQAQHHTSIAARQQKLHSAGMFGRVTSRPQCTTGSRCYALRFPGPSLNKSDKCTRNSSLPVPLHAYKEDSKRSWSNESFAISPFAVSCNPRLADGHSY